MEGQQGKGSSEEAVRSNMGEESTWCKFGKKGSSTISARVLGHRIAGWKKGAGKLGLRVQGDGVATFCCGQGTRQWYRARVGGCKGRAAAQHRGWAATEGSATQEASVVGGGLRERVGRG